MFKRVPHMYLPKLGKVYCISRPEAKLMYNEIFEKNDYLQYGISLNPKDTVFDVGANIGLFSLFANQMCNKDIVLFAFEPIPYTFSILQKNLIHQGMAMGGNVHIFNTGLTYIGGPQSAIFTYFRYMSGNSTNHIQEKRDEFMSVDDEDLMRALKNDSPLFFYLLKAMHPFRSFLIKKTWSFFLKGEEIECPLKSLSDIIDKYHVETIHLLKIDVEGAEWDVLTGIDENHWPKIRQIVMEVHDVENRLSNVIQLLTTKGFPRLFTQQPQWSKALRMRTYYLYAMR